MAEGGVRTVQHLAERGVRLVFEVWPSRCPRVLRSPETAPLERPKYTVCFGAFAPAEYQSKRAEGARRGVRKVQHLARAGVRNA